MLQCVHSLGPSRFRGAVRQSRFDKRDHRVCSANASATRIASEAVFACAIFDVTAMLRPLSRRVGSDITIPPASWPLTLSAFVEPPHQGSPSTSERWQKLRQVCAAMPGAAPDVRLCVTQEVAVMRRFRRLPCFAFLALLTFTIASPPVCGQQRAPRKGRWSASPSTAVRSRAISKATRRIDRSSSTCRPATRATRTAVTRCSTSCTATRPPPRPT